MTFDAFTAKLGEIQASDHLSIDTTISIKQQIVGSNKKLWDCTEEELDDIMDEYRNEYKKKGGSALRVPGGNPVDGLPPASHMETVAKPGRLGPAKNDDKRP